MKKNVQIFKKLAIGLCTFVLLFFLSVLVLRNQIQTLMTFPAVIFDNQNSKWKTEANFRYEEVNFQNSYGNMIYGLYVDNASQKTVYYFHGNGGPLPMFYNEIEYILDLGYNVMAYDYPGYGKSEGFPDDKEVFSTSREFFETIQAKKGLEEKDIILWGYSVGSAIAADYAYKYDFHRLVLIAPIYSRYEMSKFYFGFVLQKYLKIPDSFQNYKKIQAIQEPTLIIHGTADTIVPFDGGKKVFENSAAEVKQFIELEDTGHNNILDTQGPYLRPIVLDFLEDSQEDLSGREEAITPLDDETVEESATVSPIVSRTEVIEQSTRQQNLTENVRQKNDSSIEKYVGPQVAFSNLAYIPEDLVSLDTSYIVDTKGTAMLRRDAGKAFERMAADFYKEFETKIVVVSSYRSYLYQKGIKDRGCPDNLCSKAGHSEHQSGLAIDLWEASTASQFLAKPDLQRYYEWLKKNAHKYGYHNSYQKGIAIDGYDREPWHWRYLGIDLATRLHISGKTFTEYYFGK